MAQRVSDVMTPNPVCLAPSTTLGEAAKTMKSKDIGVVLVSEDDKLRGMVTDRDLVVRGLAEGRDSSATIADILTGDLTTLTPNDSVDDAVRVMRERAVRRVPIVEGSKPVGIVSIGDLAVERDPNSALADISAAPPDQ